MALVPDVVRKLTGQGHEVVRRARRGRAGRIPDGLFADAGATLGAGAWERRRRGQGRAAEAERDRARSARDSVLVGFLAPLTNGAGTRALAATGATAFAMEAIPRISRAQSMDALSSPGDRLGLPRGADRRAGAGPLLPDADDRRGHDPARPGARARRGRRGAAGDRDGAPARRGRDRASTCAPRSRSRSSRSARSFLEVEGSADAEAAGGYARELTEEEQQAQREALAAQIAQVRRRHHHRARARPPGAEAGHRGGGERDEAGQRDRRPRRRGGRQLRARRGRGRRTRPSAA